MKFQFDQDVEKVFHVLTDPEIYKERCESLGETNISCVNSVSGSKLTQKVERTTVRDLPGPLKKIANPENTIKSTVVWNNEGEGKRKSGSYDATIEGSPVPIAIKATFSLSPSGSGSVYEIDVKVTAKHLLLGKAIQKFAEGQVKESVPLEQEWNKKKLASLA